ncbi:hypothetical protein [Microbulbifer mangrovi]|uniref:hypothetical protein n=1 Tax=Microbulbifer mangrovi TaxID=927787 RepID=UPI0009903D22|nr:hypothetical protein [Microbulbifer mangrovi]
MDDETLAAGLCRVCETPLFNSAIPRKDDETFAVCASFECGNFIERHRNLPINLFQSQLQFHREQLRERRLARAENEARIQARIVEEEAENLRLLEAAQQAFPGLSQQSASLMVIPTGRTRMVPVSSERIENYRAHLHKVIAEARSFACASDIPQDDQNWAPREKNRRHENVFRDQPEVELVSDHLCGMCKGACCSSGRDHAYLSPLSMRRTMDENPALDDDQIAALYLSRVSKGSIEGACINQTSSGCSLPKEMRADICNAYFCDPILEYQRACAASAEVLPVFAVQREYLSAATISPDTTNEVLATALVRSSGPEFMDPLED